MNASSSTTLTREPLSSSEAPASAQAPKLQVLKGGLSVAPDSTTSAWALLDGSRAGRRASEEALWALGLSVAPELLKTLAQQSPEQQAVSVLVLLRHGRAVLPWVEEFCLAETQPQLAYLFQHHLAC